MTGFALTLILTAAFLHATWNLCSKRAGGGLPWVWLVSILICTAYAPVIAALAFSGRLHVSGAALLWILGSGVLKTSYSLFLQRSYRSGDFSLVYPLARGTGPLLSTLGAIVLFSERPSLLAILGALMIVGAVFTFAGGTRLLREDKAPLRRAVGYGAGTGAFIAAYTLWDKHGVSALGIQPVVYDAGTAYTQLALLTPFALGRRSEALHHWRIHRGYALGMALLAPTAYVLVLTAVRIAPLSAVAPAREVSIVIGAYLGARVLNEEDSRRRLVAAAVMAMGVVALVLG